MKEWTIKDKSYKHSQKGYFLKNNLEMAKLKIHKIKAA